MRWWGVGGRWGLLREIVESRVIRFFFAGGGGGAAAGGGGAGAAVCYFCTADIVMLGLPITVLQLLLLGSSRFQS